MPTDPFRLNNLTVAIDVMGFDDDPGMCDGEAGFFTRMALREADDEAEAEADRQYEAANKLNQKEEENQ